MTRSAYPNSDNDNTLDEVFHILSHHNRRSILLMIAQQNHRDIREFKISDLEITNGEGNHHLIQLYHNHLPMLVDAGLITWDRGSDMVSRGPRFDHVQSLLTLFQNHQDELPHDWP